MVTPVRVMNWNIEQFSIKKATAAAAELAQVIDRQNPDIVVLVEVRKTSVAAIMAAIIAAVNALPNAGAGYYWLLSNGSGGEHYGFLIRNIAMIRPLTFVPNPNAPVHPTGTTNAPLTDLHAVRWQTWPAAFPAAAPNPLPAPPRMPLVDAYASPTRPRATKRVAFGGQPLAAGGYSLGRGFRMPCLAIFAIRTAGTTTYLPILVCHYAAVRSGRNFLGQQQVAQLDTLHAPQLFSFHDILAPAPPDAGFLDVDGVAVPVQELVYTGDFNIDFLTNQGGGSFLQSTNRNALNSLTPTAQQGGSAAPAAVPGAVPAPLPAVPFAAFPAGPVVSNIPVQTLRAAVTTRGTMLLKYDAALNPPDTAALRGAAFDNFFYGGTCVNTAVPAFGAGGADTGDIADVPALLTQPGGAAGIDLAGVQAYYAARGTRNAATAWRLAVPPGAAAANAITIDDRWIGARLLSDHLPVTFEFDCP